MGLHLGTCEDCAAALDALSFEQEVYARYDRGLEVGPALWARVSAEIAREPQPESPEPGRPFLSRLLEGFAAAHSTGANPAAANTAAAPSNNGPFTVGAAPFEESRDNPRRYAPEESAA